MSDTADVRPEVPPEVLAAVRTKHRALWALGDYPAVAAEVVPALGPILVDAAGVRPGDRVLDVGAGSGNAAIPAALAGGQVVASDLTPELFEAGMAALPEPAPMSSTRSPGRTPAASTRIGPRAGTTSAATAG